MDLIGIGKTILGIIIMFGGLGFCFYMFLSLHNATQRAMHPIYDKDISDCLSKMRCDVCDNTNIEFSIERDNPPFDNINFCGIHQPFFLDEVSTDLFGRLKSKLYHSKEG
jgi:hypothetical protein